MQNAGVYTENGEKPVKSALTTRWRQHVGGGPCRMFSPRRLWWCWPWLQPFWSSITKAYLCRLRKYSTSPPRDFSGVLRKVQPERRGLNLRFGGARSLHTFEKPVTQFSSNASCCKTGKCKSSSHHFKSDVNEISINERETSNVYRILHRL